MQPECESWHGIQKPTRRPEHQLYQGGGSYRKRNVIGESSLFAPSIFTHPIGIHPHYVLKLQELVVFSRLLVLRHSGSELDQAHKH